MSAIDIRTLCARLLGRPLVMADGIDAVRLDAAEQRLGWPLPAALRALYEAAGQSWMLMESFQRFASPEQLEIEDGCLVFLEENQVVCHWGVKEGADRSGAGLSQVFQRANGHRQWHPEDMSLAGFLRILLYYQCAQGGYAHAAMTGLGADDMLPLLASDWEKVVEHNGLHIHWRPDCLLWWLRENDDDVESWFFSARTPQAYDRHAALYQLEAL